MITRQVPLFSTSAPVYAQVLICLDTQALDRRTFTYAVPEAFRQEIAIGTPVYVPFGRQPGLTGFVVGFTEQAGSNYAVKEIIDILDEQPLFDLAYLEFLDWVAAYYACTLSQVLGCALPSKLVQKPKKAVRLLGSAFKQEEPLRKMGEPEKRIFEFLAQKKSLKKGVSPKYLAQQLKMPVKTLNQSLVKLKQSGLIAVQSDLSAGYQEKTIKMICLIAPEKAERPRHRQIVQFLQSCPDLSAPLKTVIESLSTTRETVQQLFKAGIIAIQERKQKRVSPSPESVRLLTSPTASTSPSRGEVISSSICNLSLPHLLQDGILPSEEYFPSPLEGAINNNDRVGGKRFSLSPAQKNAVEAVLASKPDTPSLLYGVTGSGKTQVYLELTERMLTRGKGVLILLPEIALTAQIAARFIERFGSETIGLWHSHLTDTEKAETWRGVLSGEIMAMIGARSAIFAPVRNLGLIILDEEHDASFKQDAPAPRYHARTLAFELAKRRNAHVLLGSATPDVVSYHNALRDKTLLILPERYAGRPLADVELVDMRRERAAGNAQSLSKALKEALSATLEAKGQAIILINRRGFYTLLTCVTCGLVFHCRNCDVAMTYHRHQNMLRCHYCGFEQELARYCPHCASMELKLTGIGVQRVEEEMKDFLPSANILRLDSDVLQRKSAYQEVFEAFSCGEADILVGTQMIAKGLDIANVTLVGVINADSPLYLPDFKSAERCFQLLTQVAGRAGRGEKPGRVIVQSLDPNHAVVQFAKAQDYPSFYAYEMLARKNLAFPPYAQLFRFVVSATDEGKARLFIQALVARLSQHLEKHRLQEHVSFLGPAACILSRIQGRYRFHCLVKNLLSDNTAVHREIARFYRDTTPSEEILCVLDIDPQSLL